MCARPLPPGPPSPQPPRTPQAISESRAEPRVPTSFLRSRVLKLSPLLFPRPLALRMKIKEVKKENGDKKIVPKKKKPLKLGPIRKKELKKLVLYLKNGADCPCHQLDNLGHHFLIMGRKVKSQYLLTAIHKWDKKNKEFKNFMKKMKNHECPTFQSVFK